jgi:hypothetical protein
VITFNVVFTPGSLARMLPFAFSLLQGTGVRIRVVGNGCSTEEIDLLREAADVDGRISHYVLPSAHPVEHGLALNHLFVAFPEPYFAIADSDVVASGDFMASLWPLAPGQAAVFAAPPVWVADDEAVTPPNWWFLGGRHRVLSDGTPSGATYVAIYERAAIEPLWRDAPRGFALHYRYVLPRRVRASLSARGWDYRLLDTCRLVNLQLLLEGFTIENRSVPELHHVGGFSTREFEGSRMMLRNLLRTVRANDDQWLQRVTDKVLRRFYVRRSRRDPRWRRVNERRHAVRSYVDAVLDAIIADEPAPTALRTDSPEVDRRVAALVSALEAHYRPELGAGRQG